MATGGLPLSIDKKFIFSNIYMDFSSSSLRGTGSSGPVCIKPQGSLESWPSFNKKITQRPALQKVLNQNL